MKISIIIAVYNRMNYLKNILLALENQTFKEFEVIIADDGSREDVKDYLGIIKKMPYKIKHVYQEDKGFRLSSSRNNGIRHASGDFLLFLDQDILMDKNFINDVVKNIKKNKILKINALYLDQERSKEIEKVIGKNKKFSYKCIDEILEEKDFKKIQEDKRRDIKRNIIYKMKLNRRGARIIGLGIGGYKKYFLKVNGFDEKYQGWGYEDDDIGNRFYVLGLEVKSIKSLKPVVHMWHREASSKEKSQNEEYYYKRKKIIFKRKNYKCIHGIENKLVEENILVEELN